MQDHAHAPPAALLCGNVEPLAHGAIEQDYAAWVTAVELGLADLHGYDTVQRAKLRGRVLGLRLAWRAPFQTAGARLLSGLHAWQRVEMVSGPSSRASRLQRPARAAA